MGDRYIRQTTFGEIGAAGQERISRSRAAVIGLGAVGSRTAELLARAGVGSLKLIDRDVVYESNLPRMSLYREQDAADGIPKAEAAARGILEVNARIRVQAVTEDVNNQNVDDMLTGIDLVIDGTDNSEAKFLLGEACRRRKIPWIYTAAVGSAGRTQNFLPFDDWPCLRCTMTYDGAKDAPTCLTEGVLGSTTAMIAAAAAAEALKILVGSAKVRREMLYVDDWNGIFRKISLGKNPECPVCVYGRYSYYGRPSGLQAAALCGRDSVQIIPAAERQVDFDGIALRLGAFGTVKRNAFTLDFDDGAAEIKLFKNGRAIIKHAGNVDQAKSIYNRYIGDSTRKCGQENTK